MSEAADTTGSRLGAYAIERELGRGGMGTVMLGRDVALDRAVAIKLLPPELARNMEYVDRFVREARTAAKINHPNVVQVYGAGFEHKTAFIAMELVPGGNLKDLVTDLRPFPIALATDIVRQAALGLAKAHELEIIHRDLKPENVLLTPEGQVKLADFGLAFQAQGDRITVSGTYLGTPQYSSPEQCNGETLTAASDLYSLGVILFELLSGKPPYEAPTPLALFHRILTQPVPSLSDLRPELPKSLVAVVERLLKKDPRERYQAAHELAADLERIAAGLPDAGPCPKLGDSTPGAAFLVRPNDPTRIETPLPSSAADTVVASVSPQPQTPLPAELAALSLGHGHAAPPPVGRMLGRLGVLGAALVLALAGVLAWSLAVTPTRPGDVALVPLARGERGAPEDWSWVSGAVLDFLDTELGDSRKVTIAQEGYTGSPLDFLHASNAHFTVGGTYYQQGTQVAVKLEVRDASGQKVFSDLMTCSQETILTDLATFAEAFRLRLDEQARVPDLDAAAADHAKLARLNDGAGASLATANEVADDWSSRQEAEAAPAPEQQLPAGGDANAAPEAPEESSFAGESAEAITPEKPSELTKERKERAQDPAPAPAPAASAVGRARGDLDALRTGLPADDGDPRQPTSKDETTSGRQGETTPSEPEPQGDPAAGPAAAPSSDDDTLGEDEQDGQQDGPAKRGEAASLAMQRLEAARASGDQWEIRKAVTLAAKLDDAEVLALAQALADAQGPGVRRFLNRVLSKGPR